MEDGRIVALYRCRDEAAVSETAARYGRYLYAVAYRVLEDDGESDESVNDTYLKAWNTIPPEEPRDLGGYLTRIVRQIAIDRYRRRTAEKRVPTEYTRSLDELAECVSGAPSPEDEAEGRALAQTIGRWLREQPTATREIFLRRYYAAEPIGEIAGRYHWSESRVKSALYRARHALRAYLEQEGYDL